MKADPVNLDMTEVVTYKCKACGASFGPMGMHGYAAREGTGELPVVCRVCKDMFVGRFIDGNMSNPNCPKCKGQLTLFDGKCPACGEQSMIFEDMRMQGFEQSAVPAKK